jgi:hypothetical protein
VRSLPLLQTHGCTLTADGLAEQRERLESLGPSILASEAEPTQLVVRFDEVVDETIVDRLVETERGCCGFLELDYDRDARVLRIVSDPANAGVVAEIAAAVEAAR